MSLWTWARVDREYRILRSRRRSRHLRRVHEECRRGGSRLGVSPVQVVDMQRVQVGALTAAAYAQSRRRRSCPVSLQNCGTMRRAVAGGGGGKAAKAASVLCWRRRLRRRLRKSGKRDSKLASALLVAIISTGWAARAHARAAWEAAAAAAEAAAEAEAAAVVPGPNVRASCDSYAGTASKT